MATALKKPFVSVNLPMGQGPGGQAAFGRHVLAEPAGAFRDSPSPGGVWQLGFMAAILSIPDAQRQERLRMSLASVTEQRLQIGDPCRSPPFSQKTRIPQHGVRMSCSQAPSAGAWSLLFTQTATVLSTPYVKTSDTLLNAPP